MSEKSIEEDDCILSPDFFEIKKLVILIDVQYCELNKKFHKLTNDLYEIKIKWINLKMSNLFRLKSKNSHPDCVLYKGICTAKEHYIGATKRNVEIRWGDHSDINKISEPSKYLKSKPTYAFTWNV